MMYSHTTLVFLGYLLVSLPLVLARFDPSSSSNVAVYWGQNSFGQASSQQRLSYYCANTEVDIIPLAFLISLQDPSLNLASAGDICTPIAGSSLFYCSEIEQDIAECQSAFGKTILLSIGGATYAEGGFPSSEAAIAAANNVWAIFGPNQGSVPRPFGDSVIDGFDLDFESTVSNMIPFGQQLRSLMNAAGGKEYYLTAAPQCPFPDAAVGPMLAGEVSFDAVFVQFYNNYCGVQSYVTGSATQDNFNFVVWDNWAKTSSRNPNVKVLLGVPGSSTAAGSGYLSSSALGPVIAASQAYSSFGGVMVWDMSQAYANTGFLGAVSSSLGSSSGSVPADPIVQPSTTTMAPANVVTTTMCTVVVPPAPATTTSPALAPADPTPTPVNNDPGNAAGTVNQWNQCGGSDWHGGTVCKAGFTCKYYSVWYSMCV